MNKLALVAAGVLALVLLSLPPIVGAVTETRVRDRVAAIDASPNAGAEVTAFERGWFRSRATIELELVPPGVAAQSDGAGAPLGAFGVLPIVVELGHGPVAFLDGVYLGWSKATAHADASVSSVADLERTLGVPYLFEFRGRTSYLGNLAFDADAPPFELPISEALFSFSGATLAGTFDAPRLVADARIASVAIASPTGTFTVSGLQASMDNVLRSPYVLPGESSLTIASISATSPLQGAAPTLEAANLRVRSNLEIDESGTLLEMRVNYDVDSILFEDIELTAATAELRLRNVDVAAIEAYGTLVRDTAASGSDAAEILAALGPHLERAFKAGPSLALDPLRFRYHDEPVEARIEITAKADRLPPAGIVSLDAVPAMLGIVDVEADARVPKMLARDLAVMAAAMQLADDPSIPAEQLDYMTEAQSGLTLAMLAGLGVLVDEGDSYRTELDYTGGTLTLNGNPLPFGVQ